MKCSDTHFRILMLLVDYEFLRKNAALEALRFVLDSFQCWRGNRFKALFPSRANIHIPTI